MKLRQIFFSLFPVTCFALQQPGWAADGLVGMQLSEARSSTDFFRFFNLEPVGPAETNGESSIHHFRPSAPAFHELVELEVETDPADRISRLQLQLDRRFIDSPSQGVFAADIAKSFLLASGGVAERDALRSLANEIQFRNLGRTVIMHRDAVPELPPTPGNGYLTYRGRRSEWTISTPAVAVTLRNGEREGRPVLMLETAGQKPGR